MENDASPETKFPLLQEIRRRLAEHLRRDDHGTIRIVAAAAQDWPELGRLSAGQMAIGTDGLIRMALWSASRCCTILMSAPRTTLLLEEGGAMLEIRCLVTGYASLRTTRPLVGFLLKPAAMIDGRASRSADGWRDRAADDRSAIEHLQGEDGETRLALFKAFPVHGDGETAPLPGASSG